MLIDFELRGHHEKQGRDWRMPLQVLLVEDSPGDLRLTQETFRVMNPFIQGKAVNDGVEAKALLRLRRPTPAALAQILSCSICTCRG